MWMIQSKYDHPDFYPVLEKELLALIEGEKNLVANLANISSWLYHALPELNWCGFYLWQESEQQLVLGPFQGLPACLRIRPYQGVCGSSFGLVKTLRVDDVDLFPGHIACDSVSKSELVIPLKAADKVWGVLDLDSPRLARFSQNDADELTHLMNKISILLF